MRWYRLNRLFRSQDRFICLAGPVEIDAFLAGFAGLWDRTAIESLKTKIDRQMMAGDQLWDYHTRGFHQRCGMRGLALLRDGRVVKLWGLWIS